ncbi:MAG: deoxynucleoside kinase [Candidatus Paceibacterota bacterium]|jgi:thymidylate kinase
MELQKTMTRNPILTNYYCVEGLPGLGKSTALEKLPKTIFMVKEVLEEAKNVRRRERFKHKREKVRYENEWYLIREVERIKKAEKAEKEIVIFDRCIYSQMAHNFANDKILGTEELEHLFSRLIELERRGVRLTMRMIYLKATPSFSMKRQLYRNRGGEAMKVRIKANGWHSLEFLNYAKQAYERLVEVLGDNATVINVPDEQGDIEILIKEYVDRSKDSMPDISIGNIRDAFL